MVPAPEVEAQLPPPAGRARPGAGAAGALRRPGLLSAPLAGPALKEALRARAAAQGFDAFGVCAPDAIPEALPRLRAWLEEGHHGTMGWMARDPDRRADPRALWEGAGSVVVVGASYAVEGDPLAPLATPERGAVALYARRRDYHDVLKGRLKLLAADLARLSGAPVKAFVDTAPVMEKALAMAAGLGWQGKQTMLVSRAHGAWLFLGAIYAGAALPADARHADRCGTCTACVTACPTDAIPAPYRLDARRCLAYLTIEHAGPIPAEFRAAMGNRVFGCDDCLAACPWNKFAAASRDAKLAAREDLTAPALGELLALDDGAFRRRFAGTPIKRTGRDRVVRNALIAAGNLPAGHAEAPALTAAARALLDDANPVVRGAAAWALARLSPGEAGALAPARLAGEEDDEARAEWRAVLAGEVPPVAPPARPPARAPRAVPA